MITVQLLILTWEDEGVKSHDATHTVTIGYCICVQGLQLSSNLFLII